MCFTILCCLNPTQSQPELTVTQKWVGTQQPTTTSPEPTNHNIPEYGGTSRQLRKLIIGKQPYPDQLEGLEFIASAEIKPNKVLSFYVLFCLAFSSVIVFPVTNLVYISNSHTEDPTN